MAKQIVDDIGDIDIKDVCSPEEAKAQMDRIRANNDELKALADELEEMAKKQGVLK
ncbi:MAG: hypothetical protein ACI8V2_005000 [Candidatus Latescibacterota bacterium]|jgi:hypothetical protein